MSLFARIQNLARRAWYAISPPAIYSHIAIVNCSKTLPDADVNFWTKACQVQLEKFFWPAWPALPRWTVASYRHGEGMVPAKSHVILILDSGGNKDIGVIALHYITAGGTIGGRVYLDRGDHPSISLSHEVLEIAGNPAISVWLPVPPGMVEGDPEWVCREICDPTQNASGLIAVKIGGEERIVPVSDFVLPSWYSPSGAGPWSCYLTATRPFDYRAGYLPVMKDGERTLVFGEKAQVPTVDHKTDPFGRAARIKARIS